MPLPFGGVLSCDAREFAISASISVWRAVSEDSSLYHNSCGSAATSDKLLFFVLLDLNDNGDYDKAGEKGTKQPTAG